MCAILQMTPFVGAANLLRVSFASNIRLHSGSSLIISGFQNTSLSAAATLPVFSASGLEAATDAGEMPEWEGGGWNNESWIEANFSWDAREGRLVGTLTRSLEAHRIYWFCLSIDNPFTAREPIRGASIAAVGLVSLRTVNMTLGRGNFAPLFATGEIG